MKFRGKLKKFTTILPQQAVRIFLSVWFSARPGAQKTKPPKSLIFAVLQKMPELIKDFHQKLTAMKPVCMLLLSVFLPSVILGQTITGYWTGVLQDSGVNIRITLLINDNTSDNSLIASILCRDKKIYNGATKEISFTAPDVSIKWPHNQLEFQGTLLVGGPIEGVLIHQGVPRPIQFRRDDRRPMFSKSNPLYPPVTEPVNYYTEEVTISNAQAGIHLLGTLSLPSREGRFPVALLIPWFPNINRDAEFLGSKVFHILADHFTRQGIGVLRFDQRAYKNTPEDALNAFNTTIADVATDVQACIAFLKNRPEVVPEQIGLFGFAEGALIALEAAGQQPNVAFLALLDCPGIPADESSLLPARFENRTNSTEKQKELQVAFDKKMYAAIKNGTDAGQIRTELKAALKEYYEASGKAQAPMSDKEVEFVFGQSFMDIYTMPWMRSFYKFDPRAAFQKVGCPVLVVNEAGYGNIQADYHVPAIEAALRQAGNQDFTVLIIPPENPNMSAGGYRMSLQTFGPEMLQRISDWIKQRVFQAK